MKTNVPLSSTGSIVNLLSLLLFVQGETKFENMERLAFILGMLAWY